MFPWPVGVRGGVCGDGGSGAPKTGYEAHM